MNDFSASLGAGAPMIRFAKVSKRYGDLTVLDRIELDAAANEMVSIIGPSGSGKTTVLRLLMTLHACPGDSSSAWRSPGRSPCGPG